MKVEGVDNEITGNSLKARSRGKRIERASLFYGLFRAFKIFGVTDKLQFGVNLV